MFWSFDVWEHFMRKKIRGVGPGAPGGGYHNNKIWGGGTLLGLNIQGINWKLSKSQPHKKYEMRTGDV